MDPTLTQPDSTITPLSERTQRRLMALGVTVAALHESGEAVVCTQGGGRWIERVVLTSAVFTSTVRRHINDLRDAPGQPIEVWPGLWLVALPSSRRRRVGAGRQHKPNEPIFVALVMGRDILESDQLRHACNTQGLDFEASVKRVEPDQLVTEAECARLAATIAWMHEDSLEIDRRLIEIQSLSQQLGESYEELSLLYKLSSSMSVRDVQGGPAQFLNHACDGLREVVGLRWMAIQLVDDEPSLNELSGSVFVSGQTGCDKSILTRIARLLIQRHADGSLPTVIDDTRAYSIPHLARLASSLLVIPLTHERRTVGLLFGGDKLDGSQIASNDSKLCSSLANSIAIFLENAMLYEDMHAMFLGTLHALTASIDAKDNYTHGHSERVALLARMLAEAAGFDSHTVERIYISALVHDVGKIGVPESVLCKPGRLSEDEFAMIRRHPEIGATILQDIRQMQDLIPGVLYHHERFDGCGYPHGLAGHEIPLFGRLICLADSFDAMSSNRTYREAMNLKHVLGEIERCAGTQFDPELASVFVKLDFRPFYELLDRHNHETATGLAGDVNDQGTQP
ncbi:MAG: HD domain-containing protein [Phycisphaera sp.]|nr:HD domain-containing protein [Phycisphaera sp.]